MGELSSDNDEAEDHSLRPNNFEQKTSIEIGAILHGIVVSLLKGASGKISQLVVWQGQKLTSHACIPWVFQTFLMQSSCPSRFWDRDRPGLLGKRAPGNHSGCAASGSSGVGKATSGTFTRVFARVQGGRTWQDRNLQTPPAAWWNMMGHFLMRLMKRIQWIWGCNPFF